MIRSSMVAPDLTPHPSGITPRTRKMEDVQEQVLDRQDHNVATASATRSTHDIDSMALTALSAGI